MKLKVSRSKNSASFYVTKTVYIDKKEKYDGFYTICTNLEGNVNDIVKINHNRWEIEESFRTMKSEFKSRPVYLQNDNRICAHFLTCFISLLVYRILEKKLDNVFTTSTIISKLKTMNFLDFEGQGLIPACTRDDFTDKLHENLGFRTDYEIITKKTLKNIFNITQNK